MNDYVFVTVKFDYADEFDCEPIFCGSLQNFENLKLLIKTWFEINDGQIAYIYFGTNECIEVTSYDDIFKPYHNYRYREIPISFEEYQSLIRIFGKQNDKGYFVTGTGKNLLNPECWSVLKPGC